MITITDADGVVVIDVHRCLEPADVHKMQLAVNERISVERQGRVLLELRDIHYAELDATDLWFEVKRGAYMKGMVRLAVVTAAARVPDYGRFTFMAPFQIRIFPTEERQAALDWLAAAART